MAALDDIRRLREAVQQVSDMEIELGRLGSAVSGRSIELKSTIKKRLSSPNMLEVLLSLNTNAITTQMLPVPGSMYFREKIPQALLALAVFWVLCTADVFCESRSSSRFCAADSSGHAVFQGSLLWILPVLQVFPGSVVRVLQVLLAVFRPLVLRVRRVLQVSKYSQNAQFTPEYEVFFDYLCTVSIIHSYGFAENVHR